MKKYFLLFAVILQALNLQAQSCEDIMDIVRSEGYGITYSSFDREAISGVTFYDIMGEYETCNFAIGCFKRKYSYNCS